MSTPSFNLRGSQIQVLGRPDQFYAEIIKNVRQARKRIVIASLYVGAEQAELISEIQASLSRNPELSVTVLTDYLRSTRGHRPSSSLNPSSSSSTPSTASLLSALIHSHPSQVTLKLYRHPGLAQESALSKLSKSVLLPTRLQEGWGTMHLKTFVCDDTVIVSGANLSADYFRDRQDRYYVISQVGHLADYLQELIGTVGRYSFDVVAPSEPSGSRGPYDKFDLKLAAGCSPRGFHRAAKRDIELLTDRWRYLQTERNAASDNTIAIGLAVPSKSSDDKASSIGSSAAHNIDTPPDTSPGPTPPDTRITPLIQVGPWGVRQETSAVASLLKDVARKDNPFITWTSGYFSMLSAYKRIFLDGKIHASIIAAAPEANGFLNSKGLSKHIPHAYTSLLRKFFEECTKRQASGRLKLYEWQRPGWTYHAKGIWLSHTMHANPYLTLIGSSNLGPRSAERDMECSFMIETTSTNLRTAMAAEVNDLQQNGKLVTPDLFARRESMQSPWDVLCCKILLKMLGKML